MSDVGVPLATGSRAALKRLDELRTRVLERRGPLVGERLARTIERVSPG